MRTSSIKSPVFIPGCGRSGTTILGKPIGTTPNVTYLHEPRALWTSVYPEESFRAVADRYVRTVEPEEEDVRSHKRRVTPGDYKVKLRRETIRELNEKFDGVLDALGYSSAEDQERVDTST